MSRRELVQLIAKYLAEQLNKSLDDLRTPSSVRERAAILSKMLDIPKQQAFTLLEGHLIPDDNLLQLIASEFEIDISEIQGKEQK